MVGIFSLKNNFEETKPQTENFSEFHFESYFNSLQKVKNTLKFLNSGILNKDELSLVKTNLASVSIEPANVRYEVLMTEQENLKFRAEGILGDIWEKIKAFFRWIWEKIKSLLGIKSKPKPEKEEVKETQEKFFKFTYKPHKDPFIEDLKRRTEDLKKKTEELKKKQEKAEKEFFSGINDYAEELLKDFEKFAEKKPVSPEKKERLSKLKKKFSSKLSERPKDSVEDVDFKIIESIISLAISTLDDLEKLDKNLFEKAKAILAKMENVLPSSLSDTDFNLLLKSNCGFVQLCAGLIEDTTKKDILSKDFGLSTQQLKGILGVEHNHSLAKSISGKNISDETFISFNGKNYSLYEFKFDPLSITKDLHEVPTKEQNLSDAENFDRLVEICKKTDLNILYKDIDDNSKFIKNSNEALLNSIERMEGIIDKVSKLKEPPKEFNGNITFLKDLCKYASQASIMEMSYREKVTDWANSLYEFEKILTEANSKTKQG